MNHSTNRQENTASANISNLCANASLIPVVVTDDVAKAIPLAELFVAYGFPVIEVTLRTPNALKVIEAMSSVESAVVAAGTVINKQTAVDASSAGAQFLVSPGFSEAVHNVAIEAQIPLMPGVSTASEIMCVLQHNYSLLKFFPAGLNGGAKGIAALGSVFGHLQFCPTGGVNVDNLMEYVRLPNVAVVGGSWMATSQQIKQGAWKEIERNLVQVQKLLSS